MPRLYVDVPGEADDVIVEIGAAARVLLGRNPDEKSLDLPHVLQGDGPVRAVAIDSPSVSANHLAFSTDERGTTMMDVGSRHGSWLRLPPGCPVQVGTTDELHVTLVDARAEASKLPVLKEAPWTEESDYGSAVTRVVQGWLADIGAPARVSRQPRTRRDSSLDHPGRIPLASGEDLLIVPLQTMDARWRGVLQEIWRYVEGENARLESEHTTKADGIVLASPSIRKVHRQIIEAARRGAKVLLLGPSGAGKEGLAHVYHRYTGRTGAFVSRNCAMFTRDLVRAELFGAEPGAYTGLTRRVLGAVEHANGGTLFLDEVGEMAMEVQPMLLRFLDRGEFERLGEYGKARTADVRIVCATNRDLKEALERNEFRNDLWFRITNELIEVPPLRERFEDVVAFLKSRETDEGTYALDLLLPDALEVLQAHTWEGNFRELENFVMRLSGRGGTPVDGDACRDLLARGTLAAVSPYAVSTEGSAPLPASGVPWRDAVETAATAFSEDFGHDVPRSWDEVKEFLEKYFKPLLFVRLGSDPSSGLPAEARALAHRLGADRGTASKQLQRYLERFAR